MTGIAFSRSGSTHPLGKLDDEFRIDCHSAVRNILRGMAADLEMTSSELSRKLGDNPNDPVNFPLHRLPELIEATGDKTPVHWLIEKYLQDDDQKRQRAISALVKRMPDILALLEAAK